MAEAEREAPSRRRNGRPPACEPCRKRKISCDHSKPVCNRCKRRKLESSCVYLDAPMTRLSSERRVSSASQELLTPSSPSPGTDKRTTSLSNHHVSGYQPAAPRPPVPPSIYSSPQEVSKSTPQSASLFNGAEGFLGPTSFSAVFSEYRNQLDLGRGQDLPTPETLRGEIMFNLSPEGMRLGAEVLSRLPNEADSWDLMMRHINPNDGWIRKASRLLLESIWKTFGTILRTRKPEYLEDVARIISVNSNTALLDEADPEKYMASFSGPNLRWESLGIVCSYFANGALGTPENDPYIAGHRGPFTNCRDAAKLFRDLAKMCRRLSSDDYPNTLTIFMTYKIMILDSIIIGDASLIVWRQIGELAALMTSLGLHREAEYDGRKPDITSEVRRGIFAVVFNIDKVIGTFTGRPPMLSRRYCSTPLPLDLSDEALLSNEQEMADAAARLDANGWNRDNKIYSKTVLRARTMFAFVRDGILELALGPTGPSAIALAMELKERTVTQFQQLPNILMYDTRDFADFELTIPVLYARALVRLEYLQNMFLLQRWLIKSGQSNGQEILDISNEMLYISLAYWKHKDRFTGVHSDFEWIIMSYGVPASGILAIELLKQTTGAASVDNLTLPRSETIQNLSLLVASLDWVKSNAPNANLCHRIKEIIGRVLDQVLEPPSNPPSADANGLSFGLDLPTDFLNFEDFSNFDLMDTFDWVG